MLAVVDFVHILAVIRQRYTRSGATAHVSDGASVHENPRPLDGEDSNSGRSESYAASVPTLIPRSAQDPPM
jgi:hypothetical protein